MTPEQSEMTEIYLSECRKMYRNDRRQSIYEYYKRRFTNLNLTADEYENAIRKIADIIGI